VTPEEFKEMRQILWQFVPIENYGEALAELEKIARRTVSGQEAQPVAWRYTTHDGVFYFEFPADHSYKDYSGQYIKGVPLYLAAPIPATEQKDAEQ
jgi:hypothetical protein